jgi:lysophospholipase L1-like esterase
MKYKLILACLTFLFVTAAIGQEARWIASWGASPEPPRQVAVGPFQVTLNFSDQTVRQSIRLSAGGEAVRLRLSNEYGTQPLKIGAATIARVGDDGNADLETIETVAFGGDSSVTIAAGAPAVSDPIAFDVSELETLSVALYLPEDTGPCTCHRVGRQTAYVSEQGDFTSSEFSGERVSQARAFLSGVDVYTSDASHAVVLLADSITDGVGSTLDANRRWPDRLAERLAAQSDNLSLGIVNAGISGNRLLNDGAGESALARFDRDVLSVPRATHVVVFLGINDIRFGLGAPEDLTEFATTFPRGDVSVASMIAGYRQLIVRAHSKGLKIIGATITPYKGDDYYSVEGESVRQSVNEWIRDSGEFDAVLDFDAVVRDPDDPEQIAEGLHSGDFLHGSDVGYRAMADSIELSLFQ